MRWNLAELTIGVLIVILNGAADAASVMSIDLGTEFMKVAIVMPGIPMEVVPDSDSKRKTTTAIGFRANERLFASAALKLANRQPEMVFERVPSLLGKGPDHSMVERYQQWYPYHNVTFDKETGQLSLHHPTGVHYTIEELIGMLIEHARSNAERFIMTDIRSCVVTVPPYFGQAERRSLIRAVQLGGLDVLQLINSNTAVALNFGVFRRSLFNTTAQRFLFFDLGSMTTTATVASYQVGKHREGGTAGEDPILTILGTASTTNVGTTLMIRRLRDHLARHFMTKKGRTIGSGTGDITTDTRAMAKLLSEAGSLLHKLSANAEVFAQVENLFEGEDFRMKVTRSEFEELCRDEFNALRKFPEEALAAAQLTMSSIEEIVLMGGGSRIPKVQERLKHWSGRTDLGKGINGDEAGVLGAVYQATAMTPGFRVLRFVVRDYNAYPIAVDFDRAPPAASNEGGDDKSGKQEAADDSHAFIRRVLFPRANQFPQKRSITFNRHVTDLTFYLNYVDLKSDETDYLKATNLSRVETDDVTATVANTSNSEARGVKAHFQMDASGILNLIRVECLLQTIVKPEDNIEAESTLTKLSNTIGGFFGAGKKTEDDAATGGNASEAGDQNGTAPEKPTANATDEHTTGNHTDSSTIGKTESNDTKKEDEKVVKKPLKGPVAYSKTVKFKLIHLDSGAPTEKDIQDSMTKLGDLRVIEFEKRELEHAINELETVILNTRSQLEATELTLYSTESELTTLEKVVSESSDWYDEQSHDTPREDYENKLNEINTLLLPIKLRVTEGKKRPNSLSVFQKSLRDTHGMLLQMKQMNENLESIYAQMLSANVTDTSDNETLASNATEPLPTKEATVDNNITAESPPEREKSKPAWTTMFTAVEITEMETILNKMETWFKESKTKLDASPLTERPPILTEEIIAKNQQLAIVVLPYHKRLQKWHAEVEKQRVAATAGSSAPTQQPTPDMPIDLGDIRIEVPKGSGESEQSKPIESEHGTPVREDL